MLAQLNVIGWQHWLASRHEIIIPAVYFQQR
jgi:hypothetical protein